MTDRNELKRLAAEPAAWRYMDGNGYNANWQYDHGDPREWRGSISTCEPLYSEADYRAALSRIDELERVDGEGHVGIKPLEWRYDDFQSIWRAETILGQYQAWEITGHACYRRIPDHDSGRNIEGGLVAAFAAAQADYEHRIRSALVPSPSLSELTSERDALRARVEKLEGALKNLLGAFDTPIARRRLVPTEFSIEAVTEARALVSPQHGDQP